MDDVTICVGKRPGHVYNKMTHYEEPLTSLLVIAFIGTMIEIGITWFRQQTL